MEVTHQYSLVGYMPVVYWLHYCALSRFKYKSINLFIYFFVDMGQLTEGHALTWKETKKLAQHVKEHGILQFINLYKKHKDRQDDELKWGDEVGSAYFL